MKIKDYVMAQSLEQAYSLNQKKSSRILGGTLWMRMSSNPIQTAIDLSGLGLDTIEEDEQSYRIGCMVTLRQLEIHRGLNEMTDAAVAESVRSIVGVQFRNLATVGGSIFGRFGFSDVLTCFLALDTQVELYRAGIVPLEEFAAMKRDRDILVRLIVKKEKLSCAYLSRRNTRTDFPVLACGVSMGTEGRVTVGARPSRAVVCRLTQEELEAVRTAGKEELQEVCQAAADRIVQGLSFESNMRASAAYRRHLAGVLVRRGLMQAAGKEEGGCRLR